MITEDQIRKLRNKSGSVAEIDVAQMRKRHKYDKNQEALNYPNIPSRTSKVDMPELPDPTGAKAGPKKNVVIEPIGKARGISDKTSYANIPNQPDYAVASKSAGKKPGWIYDTFKGSLFDWGQFDDDQKKISTLVERASTQEYTDAAGIKNVDDIGMTIASMTDTDKGIYNYIFNTQGRSKADEYLNELTLINSKEKTLKMQQDLSEFSKDHKVLGSLASVAATPLKWSGLYDSIVNRDTSKEINPYGIAFYGSNVQEASRGAISEDMGDKGSFFYNTGMSILDSLVASVTGTPWAGAAMLAGGAGTDAIKDAKERGATDNQALLSGLASGTAEAVFERISLGNLKSLKEVPIKSIKDVAKNTVKSVFTNASEEAATELSNIITDHIIMQDLSNYSIAYQGYLDAGMSEKTAQEKTISDLAKQIGLSGIAGGLSGGAMSAVGQGSNYARGSMTGKNIDNADADMMLDKAKSTGEGNDLYNLALQIEKQKQNNKQATNYQKARLAYETQFVDAPMTQRHSENGPITTPSNEMPTQEIKQARIDKDSVKKASVTWAGIEEAKVTGIASVENNIVKVNIESGGETITDTIDRVTFEDPQVKEVYSMAEEYKSNGAKAFISNYQDNTSLEVYKKGFNDYYDAGLIELPMNKIDSAYGTQIGEEARFNAYQSGINDSKILTPKAIRPDYIGLVDTDASKKMDATIREGLDSLGKAAGVKIQVEESIAGGAANGMYKDGTLYIARDSENPYMVVAKHELTHAIQESSPESYKKYKDFVIAEINKSNSEAYNEMVDKLINRYAEIGQQITRDIAQDEIVADATEMFFTDSDIINELSKNDRNLAQKVIEAIKKIIEKIQTAIGNVEPKSNAAIELNKNLDIAKQAEKLWAEALVSNDNVDTKQSPGNEEISGVSVNETYNRFSLKDVEPVQPTSKEWQRSMTFAEVQRDHPTLFALDSDETDTKNPTSVATTVSTYNKIYDILKAEEFEGNILDASSGIGNGTESGIKNYKFNVEDVEPFPPSYANPKYTDYSEIDKKYDVIISNAVINVLPQDLRDSLVVRMSELLKDGGRMFINVRGNDVIQNKSNSTINDDLLEYFVESSGSYQKGYTSNELIAYLQDALGKNYIIEPTKKFGKVSAIATKLAPGNQKFSLKDPDVSTFVESAKKIMSEENYEVYGLRRDSYDYNIGDTTNNSHQLWQDAQYDDNNELLFPLIEDGPYKGFYDEGELNGACSIGVKEKTLEKKLDAMKMYPGTNLYLIAGDYGEQGNDIGELIIQDATVVAKLSTNMDSQKFSLKDSDGRDLSKEQQKFFKDSKARDSKGNLEVAYHGTGSTITEFKESLTGQGLDQYGSGFYFSTAKEVADMYQTAVQPGVEKLGGADNPNVISAYLNIINPIIADGNNLRDSNIEITLRQATNIIKAAPDIYNLEESPLWDWHDLNNGIKAWMIEDVAKSYTGASLMSLENDFYRGRATEFRKSVNKTTGYDGVVHEFPDGSKHYVAWFPNQIKSVDNLAPTDAPDIRYQLKDVDKIDYRRLKKENQNLTEAYELLQQQFQLTAKMKPDQKAIERTARSILKKYSSKYDYDTMVENMETIWKYIQENKDSLNTGQTVHALSGMAKKILEKSTVSDSTIRDQYKDLINSIKKTPINLSQQDRADLASEGGYYVFKRNYRNKINLVEDGGISIDSYFSELAKTYPEFFIADEVTHPAEQLIKIADTLDSLKPITYNPYGMNIDEASIDMAIDIFDGAYLTPQVKPLTAPELYEKLTQAEKNKKAELERLHTKYQEKIENVRREYRTWYNERLSRIKNESETQVKKLLEQHNKASEHEKGVLMRQIQRLRDSKAQRLKAQQERYNERMQAYKERKATQADKNKWKADIIKIAKDLSAKLLRPSDTKHIPTTLKSSIIQVCQMLDFDTGRTGKGGEPTQVTLRLKNLQSAYAKLGNESDSSLSGFFDEDMAIAIDELADVTAGKRIYELSNDELKTTRDILRHIRYIVNQENKMLKDNIKETVSYSGEEQMNSLDNSKEFKQMSVVAKSKVIKAFADLLGKGNLKPYYFFKQIGGPLERLYKNVRDGEDRFIRNFEAGKDHAKEIIDRYDYFSWAKKDTPQEFDTRAGEKISLTIGEKLYIYMAYQREQGKGHILGGGIVPSSQVTKKGKTTDQSKPISFTENDIARLSSTLTDEQKAFANEMGEYLSNELAELGNETSRKMYGYEKFTEKKYIPLTSDPNFLGTKMGAIDDRKIKRSGFTKATVQKANNPIIAADFLEIWSKHLIDMSMYNALVLPLEDFQRVWNYRVKDNDGKARSVGQSIQRAYGKRANNYIKNLLIDINGGIKAPIGGEISNIMLAKMKADAVMGNLSVAIQQPSAIARAMVIISPKYFAKTSFSKRDYNEVKKYTPLATLKEYGYFDVNMGRNLIDLISQPEYQSPQEKFKAFFTDKNVRNEAFSWLPQKMDEVTWAHIWNAVKAETTAETNLTEGTEDFYGRVAERFKEVIDRTQVYDSVFQRSEIMRSQNFAAKLATNFMSEPTVSYNMLHDAITEFRNNGKNASPYVARTIGSVISAMVLNSLLKSIVTAMRDKDEVKEFAEKYLDSFVSNLVDDPLGMIPYANTVVSIFQGYSASRPDMQVVTNIIQAFQKVDSDKYTTKEKALQIAQALAPFIDVPLKNITRDIETIYRNGIDMLDNKGLVDELPKDDQLKFKYDIKDIDNTKATSEYYNYLYSIKGTEEYNQLFRELVQSGRKASNINQAMSDRARKELKENPIIVEAVDAFESNDIKNYKAAIDKLKKDYTSKEILASIDSLKSDRAKANAPTAAEFIKAYKSGDKKEWQVLFKKLKEAGWSQEDILELVK